jgi:hypothetical protein
MTQQREKLYQLKGVKAVVNRWVKNLREEISSELHVTWWHEKVIRSHLKPTRREFETRLASLGVRTRLGRGGKARSITFIVKPLGLKALCPRHYFTAIFTDHNTSGSTWKATPSFALCMVTLRVGASYEDIAWALKGLHRHRKLSAAYWSKIRARTPQSEN